jgi:hypothetical protein
VVYGETHKGTPLWIEVIYERASMNSTVKIFLFYCLISHPAHAQDISKDLEPGQYFNFWIGEWDLSWEDADGSIGAGKNIIRRVLNDQVLEENFTAITGQFSGFLGKSWSVYDTRTGIWKQTWVDNNGGYLDFTGGVDGENRFFRREGVDPSGRRIIQRMIFHEITNDSLIWDWEVSYDNGETWNLRWRIFYRRVKS